MTKRYTGGVVSSSLPTVNAAGASGVFLLSQQADYQSRNSWPPFKVEESLRFRSSATGYLSRTPASAGNRKTWTWSGWVKRSGLGVSEYLFSAGTGGTDTTQQGLNFQTDNTLRWTSSATVYLVTTQVFRDPSAWYHIVFAFDTTQATANDRQKIYVNGTQITAFTTQTNPTQNLDYAVNQAAAFNIGRWTGASNYFDGYMADINFVDGQALTPSSFGATDKDGNWSPIAYTGTYGTNGFYVNFRDNTSATTMGYDYSGNGNNWTLNGFNVSTANTTYDIMIDVPEDQSDGTANNRGNYCTLNPIKNTLAAYGTISDGNLKVKGTNGSINCLATGTMAFAGKMYCEITIEVRGNNTTGAGVGVVPITNNQFQVAINMSAGIYYLVNGEKEVAGTNSAYGSSYTTGDVIGIAVDTVAETVTFYKNNVSQGSISGTGVISAGVLPYIGFEDVGSPSIICNFGQRPFAYTPPSDFKALNTFNLPEPTIKQPNKHFNAVTYTGAGAGTVITTGFYPDFAWMKNRTAAFSNFVQDSVRGGGVYLLTDANFADDTVSPSSTFSSTGITINGLSSYASSSSYNYVLWAWKANAGSTVTNTAGSITSTVSANPTAGFSVATYTGNGSTGATVGHGLDATPAMIIVKNRSGVNSWIVQHQSLTGITYNLYLNGTDSQQNDGQFTAKSSTTVTLRSGGSVNTNSSNYVMYCFAPIAGYSAFGSYTGNGSTDGTFVYTGFRPKFVIIKSSSNTEDWRIFDTSRSTYNIQGATLYANDPSAENAAQLIDINSNGFKMRTTDQAVNSSGWTYIYMAFAEMPFKYARAR